MNTKLATRDVWLRGGVAPIVTAIGKETHA